MGGTNLENLRKLELDPYGSRKLNPEKNCNNSWLPGLLHQRWPTRMPKGSDASWDDRQWDGKMLTHSFQPHGSIWFCS